MSAVQIVIMMTMNDDDRTQKMYETWFNRSSQIVSTTMPSCVWCNRYALNKEIPVVGFVVVVVSVLFVLSLLSCYYHLI